MRVRVPGRKAERARTTPPPLAGARSKDAALVRWVRLAVQLVFFALAPAVFSTAFAGLKYLFVQVGAGKPVELTGFVALFAGVCLFTVVFGRFFCGYACAFGTLGDALYQLGYALTSRLGLRRPRIPERVEDALRCVKYLVLAGVLVACVLGAASFVNENSPWSLFGHLINISVEGATGFAILAFVFVCVLMLVKERSFCEFLCPLGAVFSLLPVLPFSRVRRDMDACTACGRCQRACPVNIYPPDEGARMGECVSCNRCEPLCPESCVSQGKGRSGFERRRWLIRTLALAALLLALFWVAGAVRFLPAAPFG